MRRLRKRLSKKVRIRKDGSFDMKSNRISVLCVLAAGLLWGCMGILVRTMNKGGFSALEVTAFRSFVTAIVMVVGMFLFNRKSLKIRLKDVWCFIGTGILSVIFFNICYFSCMNYTTLSVAAILLYTAPSFVMLLSFFLFQEKLSGRKVLALGLAFLGCVLVSGGLGRVSIGIMGVLTGLGAGFGYALYSIFSRYAILRGYSSYTITTYTFVFAAIGSVPIIDGEHMLTCLKSSVAQIPFEIFMVVITTVLAYSLYTNGLKGIENGKASVIASIEPVMASVVGMVLYGEKMTFSMLFGIMLVLVSSILINTKEKNKLVNKG